MKCFVTGGAGFIGSHLVERLLEDGNTVTGFDNLRTGRRRFLDAAFRHPSFQFVDGDLLDSDALTSAMNGSDFIFHLAANADVRFGVDNPRRDLDQNIIATFNVLESMRTSRIQKIAFASSGSIYGEAPIIPTPEHAFFPIQTSLYGAAKTSSEGLIQAYCEGFNFQSWTFRFVSILGERYHHGHVFDFLKQLKKNPNELQILGDGTQKKSYLYVKDCIEAMLTAIQKSNEKVNIFNLGTDEYIEVADSINTITNTLKMNPKLKYAGGKRGWIGDNPFIFLDCSKIRALGWKPTLSIREGIGKTVAWLNENSWIFQHEEGRP